MSKQFADRRHNLLNAVGLSVLLSACASRPPTAPVAAAGTQAAATSAAAAATAPIPDAVRHAYDAALTSMQAADWEGAERALKPIVDAHPELPGPAVNLGIVYVHLNRADEARKIVDSAAQRSPGFAPAQHQLGRILAAAGDFQAADAAYAHAQADDPHYALAYYDRGVLNELYLQRLPEALKNYEAFQQLQTKPDDQVARWITDLRRRTGVTAPVGGSPGGPANGAAATPAAATAAPVPAATAPAKPSPASSKNPGKGGAA